MLHKIKFEMIFTMCHYKREQKERNKTKQIKEQKAKNKKTE